MLLMLSAVTDLTLWYDRPDWETQALPIGNGALGAMAFGGTDTERLQFNEKSLWTGGPGSREGYDFGDWSPRRPGRARPGPGGAGSRRADGAGGGGGRAGARGAPGTR
ncbi:glycoside hydrolase N-terminal domain-containing protein [Nonomuraea jabiensis]|uniref:glycoside hydrolase N-terminal domain-containing protein n=1 Tax=Nonomuraea jabiensis TaxID=882448 RepID=UPI0028AC7736|nr:glycoside hydrolase N-terminal domain-containing protein [Nonomuraea jabiensis]